MRIMGMNETSMIAGDLSPMPATTTISPRVTARLYAGAVEAIPITMLDSMPTALVLRPLASSTGRTVASPLAVGSGSGTTAPSTSPPSEKPWRRGGNPSAVLARAPRPCMAEVADKRISLWT